MSASHWIAWLSASLPAQGVILPSVAASRPPTDSAAVGCFSNLPESRVQLFYDVTDIAPAAAL